MTRCAVLLAALLPACTWFSGDQRVLVTSEPPGARILLDGADTGRTTPAMLEVGGMLAPDRLLTLRKQGYQDEHRLLTHHTEGYTSRWIDGAGDIGLLTWPIFWTPGDFVFPVGVRWAYVPGDLYVRLYREGEPTPVRLPPPEPVAPPAAAGGAGR